MNKKSHWEDIYAAKKSDELSWHQVHPELSLQMIKAAKLSPQDHIIDVGGGTSRFVDCLLDLGYENLTVLDISKKALESTKQRLGDAGRKINWIDSDIAAFKPMQQYRFWHDRAVFHFLTDDKDRRQYLEVMNRAIDSCGYVMIAAFAMDGPEKCSSLPVHRYSHESLRETLGPNYEMIRSDREMHTTPWGATQSFIYSLFRKVG